MAIPTNLRPPAGNWTKVTHFFLSKPLNGIFVAVTDTVFNFIAGLWEQTVSDDPISDRDFNMYWAGNYVDSVATFFIGYRGPHTGHIKEPRRTNAFSSNLLYKNRQYTSLVGNVAGVALATATDNTLYVLMAVHDSSAGFIRIYRAERDNFFSTDTRDAPVEIDTIPYPAESTPVDGFNGIVSFSGDGKLLVYLDDSDIIRPEEENAFGSDTEAFRGAQLGQNNETRIIKGTVNSTVTAVSSFVDSVESPEGLFSSDEGATFGPDLVRPANVSETEDTARISTTFTDSSLSITFERTIVAFYVDQTIKTIKQKAVCSVVQKSDTTFDYTIRLQKTGESPDTYNVINTARPTFDGPTDFEYFDDVSQTINLDWTITFPDATTDVINADYGTTMTGRDETYFVGNAAFRGGTASGFRGHIDSKLAATESPPAASDRIRTWIGPGKVPLWQYVDMYTEVYAYSVMSMEPINVVSTSTGAQGDLRYKIEQHVIDQQTTDIDKDQLAKDDETQLSERTFTFDVTDVGLIPEVFVPNNIKRFAGRSIALDAGTIPGSETPVVAETVPISWFFELVYVWCTETDTSRNLVTEYNGGTIFNSKYKLTPNNSNGHFRFTFFSTELDTGSPTGTRQMKYATDDDYDDLVDTDNIYVSMQ